MGERLKRDGFKLNRLHVLAHCFRMISAQTRFDSRFFFRENRQTDSRHNCRPHPAVAIEPSLRPQSPENGNILKNGRRLSAIWPAKIGKWESGDRRQVVKARWPAFARV